MSEEISREEASKENDDTEKLAVELINQVLTDNDFEKELLLLETAGKHRYNSNIN